MPINRLDCAGFFAAVFMGVLVPAQVARAAHHEAWLEIKSPHFTVYSNAGEHDGRRVALEFEEIRAMFAQAFPKLKVDSGGKPTIIYALRDEDSLKLLMPNYGQNKNAIKLAGLYFPAYDKNFAVVRTDLIGSGRNPYHVMYHEYAHELFRLNYRGLPLWLDEGMAEYWGFSDIENKEAVVGTADPRHIQLLQHTPLLPLTTLFSIDATSPLYNTQDHSGMFYAESWALVHYLSMAPEVRDQNLLNKYLAALQKTDDPISAANQTFGDLKKFSDTLESYVRNQAFFYNKLKLNSDISEKSFSARALPPAEGLVHQADYLLHSNHLPEAIAVLHDAEQLEAKAPGLHDALGYYHFQKADYENAEKEFALALEGNPDDASVFLYRASTLYRRSGYNRDSTPQIIANLEKVLALQPNFAPAQAFLCMAYIATPDQKTKALEAAERALDLEPGNMAYFLDYGRALLANGKQKEAQMVAERAEKTATWQRDRAMAAAFSRYVSNARGNAGGPIASVGGASVGTVASGADSSLSTDNTSASGGSAERAAAEVSAVDGKITELICGHPPAVMFTLTTPTEQYLLQVRDISKLELKDAAGNSAGSVATCASWKGRKAKVSYRLTPDGPVHGEVKSIAFE